MGRRDGLTLGAWPQYNSTLAPTSTRSNFAVAEDPDGLVVFTGGNKDDILCMFDGRQNGWQNATARLTDQSVFFANSTPSPSASPASSSTSTSAAAPLGGVSSSAATATPTPAGVGSGSNGLGTNTLLAVVLSSVSGIALVLGLVYFCLRRRRRQQAHLEAGHMRRSSGVSSTEKDGIGFASDSLPRGPSGGSIFRGHQHQDSQNSFSSMAILMGRVNQQNQQDPPGVKRKPSSQTQRSSSSSLFNKAFKSTISKPIPQMVETAAAVPPPPQSREEKGVSFAAKAVEPRRRTSNAAAAIDRQGSSRRSSGWNRYWSGGSALNILGFGSGNAPTANSKRTTGFSDRSSTYSDHSHHHRITQDSAIVPPLNTYEPRASFSRVNTGSPTISHYDNKIKEGMKGQIERPVSAVSDVSGYSSGIPASVHEAWDPTTMQKPWGSDRASSSAYSSIYVAPLGPSTPPSRSGHPPTGVSRQPQLATAATSSDMSWLNLGDYGNSRV